MHLPELDLFTISRPVPPNFHVQTNPGPPVTFYVNTTTHVQYLYLVLRNMIYVSLREHSPQFWNPSLVGPCNSHLLVYFSIIWDLVDKDLPEGILLSPPDYYLWTWLSQLATCTRKIQHTHTTYCETLREFCGGGNETTRGNSSFGKRERTISQEVSVFLLWSL